VNWSHEIDVALGAAQHAAAEIRRHYGSNDTVQYKMMYEPVTAADLLADQILRETILEQFPNDGWLSEETQDSGTRLTKDRVWIVDPLDGTREFIQQIPEFCVSVSLIENDVPVVAVVINPVTKDQWIASKGGGTWQNGTRVTVTENADPQNATTAVSRSEMRRGALQKFENQMTLVPLGGMVSKLVSVADGQYDATFTCFQRREWDVATGCLMIAEAGGTVSQLNGKPIRFNQADSTIHGIVATNAHLHDSILEQVQAVLAVQRRAETQR